MPSPKSSAVHTAVPLAPLPADAGATAGAFASFGPRMKALRRLKQMTVEELGDAIGVNKAHISRLERGLKTPSISVMAKLATALGTSIGHLVGETLDKADIKVTRQSDLAPRYRADEPAQHQFAPLLHGHSVGSFEAFVIYPGADGAAVHAQHEGQEMLYVLSGTIDVSFSDRTERLTVGDCIHFPGYLTHALSRVGRAQARALLVLSTR